ncbi:MAG: MFS transporter [Candidatus Bathyarchaeia archaeon]
MHRFSEFYRSWGRNAKVLVLTEPLWSIPMSWVFFYRPIFMRSLGITEVEIGLMMTLYSILQIFLPLFGGYLADRFGRKRVLMLFDVVGWTTAMSLWIMARELWHMMLAIIFEALITVIYSVWECMLIEDTAPEYRASIFSTINLIYVVGSLLTPLAGFIVMTYGIETGCRILFTVALTSLCVMFTVRQIFLRETEVGSLLLREQSDLSGFKGYRKAIRIVFKTRIIFLVFICSVLGGFYYTVSSTYSALYLTDSKGLGLSGGLASIVPASSSVVSILLLTTVLPRVKGENSLLKVLVFGYILAALSVTTLIVAPNGCLTLAVLAGVLGGFYILVYPTIRTILVNRIDMVDEKAKAKILSLSTTSSALVNWLTPTLAGYAYVINPKIPFIVSAGILTVNAIIAFTIKTFTGKS